MQAKGAENCSGEGALGVGKPEDHLLMLWRAFGEGVQVSEKVGNEKNDLSCNLSEGLRAQGQTRRINIFPRRERRRGVSPGTNRQNNKGLGESPVQVTIKSEC